VALLAAMAWSNVARQLDYRSEIALWEASLREAPWNARAHNNLGYAYHLAGRRADAQREFRAALVFDPRYEKARLNLLLLD
jgi:Flp pilus assembly protein TadD